MVKPLLHSYVFYVSYNYLRVIFYAFVYIYISIHLNFLSVTMQTDSLVVQMVKNPPAMWET